MQLITQGKTNWKFLLIVVVLAVVVGGGAIYCQYKSVECNSPADCEGKTHIMCVGQWECINNQCSWDCQIEEEQLKDETADWQAYKNGEYGFEIKYPPDFILQDYKSYVTFCGGDVAEFCGIQGAAYHPEIYLFILEKADARKDLYSFVFGDGNLPEQNYWPFGKHPDTTDCQVVPIVVASTSGKLWDCNYGTGFGAFKAFWERQEDEYFYYMGVSLYDKHPQQKDIFNQILSTFRFLE